MGDLTLAIMAAGMGSRYGGMKQIDRLGGNGEILMEYGIYDAIKAGFNRVVIIIKEHMIDGFKETAGNRMSKSVKLDYAFQRMTDVPGWFEIPETREKPWGTAHAVTVLDRIVDGPFCVINADDFYGAESYKIIAGFLNNSAGNIPACCMAGYGIGNALSENGPVTRGVCDIDESRKLKRLVERYKISRRADGVILDEASGTEIPEKTSVSMNMFGFQAAVPALLKERFGVWLNASDVLKGEYQLPTEVSAMVNEKVITVDVLPTPSTWYGVTYKEDKAPLMAKIREMIAAGVYPESLWGNTP